MSKPLAAVADIAEIYRSAHFDTLLYGYVQGCLDTHALLTARENDRLVLQFCQQFIDRWGLEESYSQQHAFNTYYRLHLRATRVSTGKFSHQIEARMRRPKTPLLFE